MPLTLNGTTGLTLPTPLTPANGGSGVATITGLVEGNGTSAFTAAIAGTDYVAPGGALGTPSSGTLTNCTGYPRQTGDRDLLTTLTASNSAALQDATILSTAGYTAFEIEFINLVPVTNAQSLIMRVYSNGAYQSGAATYSFGGIIPTNSWLSTGTQAQISYTSTASSTASFGGISGFGTVRNPAQTSAYKSFAGILANHNVNGGTQVLVQPFAFQWQGGTTAVTGFQCYFASGNISTGSIKVWGLK